jgi:hypothetical protein
MNNFMEGMGTIGQLFPSPYPSKYYPSRSAAWQGVASSFRQTGDSLRKIEENYTLTKQERDSKAVDDFVKTDLFKDLMNIK